MKSLTGVVQLKKLYKWMLSIHTQVETVKGGKILKLRDNISKTTPEHSPTF